jgi:hypothetical protein
VVVVGDVVVVVVTTPGVPPESLDEPPPPPVPTMEKRPKIKSRIRRTRRVYASYYVINCL